MSTNGSFHGRSFATVSITGQAKYREGFGPLVGPVEFIDYGDLDAAREGARRQARRARSSSSRSRPRAASSSRRRATSRGCASCATTPARVLIFDEVQTGVGRTGKWFGHQHDGVEPDVMTLAKGLGGGVPIGAVACSEKAAAGLAAVAGGAVPHASTFGGNPLACAAANAVFEIIERERLVERVAELGEYLGGELAELVAEFPGHVVDAARARPAARLRGQRVAGHRRRQVPREGRAAVGRRRQRRAVRAAVHRRARAARRGGRRSCAARSARAPANDDRGAAALLHARRPRGLAAAVGPRRARSSATAAPSSLAGKTRRARVREGVDAHARVVRGRRCTSSAATRSC